MLVPSAAAERPSRVAAYFQITYGRPRRGRRSARRCCRPRPRPRARPDSTSTPAARSAWPPPPPATGLGSAHGDHDPGDAGPDQRVGARAGAPGVVARLQGDHGGAAAGPLAGLGERHDLGVRAAGVRVEALADDVAGGVEQDAADDGVGAGGAEAAGGERDRAAHRRVVGTRARHAPRPVSRACGSRAARTAGRDRAGHRGAARRTADGHGSAGPRIAHAPQRTAATRSVPRAVSHPDCLAAGG